MFLGGVILLMTTGLAFGQSVSGGCSGTINQRPPNTLTSDNPLVVGKGENVRLVGNAPPGKAGGQTFLNYTITLIEGIAEPDGRTELHGEGASWRGSVNVDQYLRASGLYKISGTVTTTTGSYSCPVSFYVRLDGSKIVGIVGAGIAGAGGLGVIRASQVKKPETAAWGGEEPPPPPESARPTADEIKKDFGKDVDKLLKEPPTEYDRAATAIAHAGGTVGCIFWPLLEWLFDLAPAAVFFSSLADGSSQRMWSKGRTVLGFISGLIFGLGGTVALQQFGFWTLNPTTLFAVPVTTAVVGSVRAWRGTAFKVVSEEAPPPPPAPELLNKGT